MNKAATNTARDPYEPVADDLIQALGGDPRDAVIALLGEREYLTGRIEALEAVVSWGFVRVGAARQGRSQTTPESSMNSHPG